MRATLNKVQAGKSSPVCARDDRKTTTGYDNNSIDVLIQIMLDL